MLESFPFGLNAQELFQEDFLLFSQGFRGQVDARIPHDGEIYFLHPGETLPKVSSDPQEGVELAGAVAGLQRGEFVVDRVRNNLLFGFTLADKQRTVVGVTNVDAMILDKVSGEWLVNTLEELRRDFSLFKSRYRDPETGVLNSTHLFELVSQVRSGPEVAVVLIQLTAGGGALRRMFQHCQLAARVLAGFTSSDWMLHHVGQAVFALLVPVADIGSVEKFCSRCAQYLQRENFQRVHIGASRIIHGRELPLRVLDEAWTALRTAIRRGPSGFCDYSYHAVADEHPLRPIALGLLESYRRLVRRKSAFTILALSLPEGGGDVQRLKEVVTLPADSVVLGVERGYFIYLPEQDGEKALRLAEELVGSLTLVAGFENVGCGVSSFPFLKYSRSETLGNAGKALLHAELLGAGKVALFDGVSLNVSGDILFGDGDYTAALREYRRGVECSPDNVNLLNSLGVTYALLNKNTLARSAFLKVLEIDSENALALYNLGLRAQLKEDFTAAIDYFERAVKGCLPDDDSNVCGEVEIQLGRLYCLTGRYAESLVYLESWQEKAKGRQRGRAFRYLGEAYLGVDKPAEAMRWLQRAFRYDSFDHDVLSLLGCATWRAGEGDDIALSFCRKSVDLAPNNPQLRLRLSSILQDMGYLDDALQNLKACRAKGEMLTQVQLAKASLFLERGEKAKARTWAGKVMKRCARRSESYRQAKNIIKLSR